MKKQKKQQPQKPFFVRFLEKQQLEDISVSGGAVTLKYPSDRDE